MDQRTDGRTDTPSYRDARTHLKIAENSIMQDEDASYVVYTALFYEIPVTPKQVDVDR